MCSSMTSRPGPKPRWTLTTICIYVFSYDKSPGPIAWSNLTATCIYVFSYDKISHKTAWWTLTGTCIYVFSYDKLVRKISLVNINSNLYLCVQLWQVDPDQQPGECEHQLCHRGCDQAGGDQSHLPSQGFKRL